MKPEDLARDIWERELSPEEFERWVQDTLADADDMENVRSLIAWFTRRYPTPFDRLAYVRRKVRSLRKTYGDRVVGK